MAVDPAELDSELLLLSNLRHLKNKEPDQYKKYIIKKTISVCPPRAENVPNWVGSEYAKIWFS